MEKFVQLSAEPTDISMIYLAWLPYGVGHFKKFIKSYLAYNSGYPHQLVIVFNGTAVSHPDNKEAYLEHLREHNISEFSVLEFPGGQDIEIYKQVAAMLTSDRLLFCNTFSELHADDWLKKYNAVFTADTGIVSATASRQSYYSSVFQQYSFKWETKKGFSFNFRKYKLFIKALFYWRLLFHPFPNPHLRTNAFMVRRTEFLQMKVKTVNTKLRAYVFENGRKSLTNYYLRKGMGVLVLDKYGTAYKPGDWKLSNTFWIGEQKNLLVSDNQTALYCSATAAEQKMMTKLAWGND